MIDNLNLKPEWWLPKTPEESAWVPFTETTGDPAAFVQDAPATVERLSELDVVWPGGHPGLDLPSAVLERENAGNFEPYQRPGGLPYDNDAFETVTVYEGRCSRSQCNDHKWRLRWQEGRDFPLGRYRFHISGHAFKGGVKVDYDMRTSVFQVVPSTKLWVYGAETTATGFSARIVDAPQLEWSDDNGSITAEPNQIFLRSESTPASVGAALPITDQVTLSGSIRLPSGTIEPITSAVTLEVVTERRKRIVGKDADGAYVTQDERDRPTTKLSAPSPGIAAVTIGDFWLDLTVTDSAGNSGTITATISR